MIGVAGGARPSAARGARLAVSFTVGPLLWFAHLMLLYGGHALLCRNGATDPASDAAIRTTIGATTLVLLVILVLLTRRTALHQRQRNTPRFYRPTVLLLLLLSAIAIVWQSAGALTLPLCI